MNRVWSVIRHEVYVTLRRRGYLVMTLGVPLVAAVAVTVYLVVQGGSDDNSSQNPLAKLPDHPIGYVDLSGEFGDPGELSTVFVAYPDEESAAAAVEKGEIDSYYVISADFMESGNVTRKARQLDFMSSDTELFRAFIIYQLLQGEHPRLLIRLNQPARVIEHQLDAKGVELSQMDEEERYGSNFVLVYGFALVLVMSTFVPAGYLLRSVVDEKENRTIEIVLSSLRPLQLMLGKVLGQGIMGLLQIALWLLTAYLLFRMAVGEVPGLSDVDLSVGKVVIVVLYYLGGFLFVASLQAGLGAVSTNMREGPQYAAVFTFPMVIPLWLLSIFLEAPNGNLAVVLSLIPITSPLAMVQRIAITSVPAWQIVLSLALLGIAVLAALWLSARIFRVHTLLAGTVPKPSEWISLLRND
jgi:ABC-2 type transport system permease protein